MGSYNETYLKDTCPICHAVSDIYIQWHFRDTRKFKKLNIGDPYPWLGEKAYHNGGRPENGTVEETGIATCSICQSSFDSNILIENDIIKKITLTNKNEFRTN